MSLRIGSLFTGYGGLDMGVQMALGGTVAWHSDIDPGASRILAHHWPDVPNLGDITAIDWSTVEPVDVLTGGFPCQGISHAGKGLGLADERSGLWAEMARAIDGLCPQLVVIENVAALRSARSEHSTEVRTAGPRGGVRLGRTHRALGVVLADLASLGYDARWGSVRASDAGAPHRRERVFIVAHPHGAGWEGSAPSGSDPVRERPTRAPVPRMQPLVLLPTPAVNDMGAGKTPEAWDAWTDDMRAKHGNGNGHGKSLAIEAQRLLPTPTATDHKASGGGYNGQTNVTLTDATVRQPDRWGDYGPAIRRWEQILRPAPEPTVGGRLNPVFAEWMMGPPEGHITDPAIGLSRPQQLKVIGNGVCPQQGAYAVWRLLS